MKWYLTYITYVGPGKLLPSPLPPFVLKKIDGISETIRCYCKISGLTQYCPYHESVYVPPLASVFIALAAFLLGFLTQFAIKLIKFQYSISVSIYSGGYRRDEVMFTRGGWR